MQSFLFFVLMFVRDGNWNNFSACTAVFQAAVRMTSTVISYPTFHTSCQALAEVAKATFGVTSKH